MARGACPALASLLCGLSGCSLVLDFSDGAAPTDGSLDAPFSDADCAYKEPNDSVATAAALVIADTGPAAICPGATEDHDFYRFTVPANTSLVQVKIDFASSPTGDLDLRLYDKTGATVLARSSSFGNEELIACPGSSPPCATLAPDDYVFEVFPAVDDAVNTYTFAITLTPARDQPPL
jgi:hypothetical protein